MKNKYIDNEGGVNGLGIGILNTNSKEFKFLRSKIAEESGKQSKKQKLENKLLSLRFQMESYLENEDTNLIEVGWFLKEFIKSLNVKNRVFAEYIGFKETNLSALFKGTRKINIDLALKLEKIFNVNASLWIHIQSKNELIKMSEENKRKYLRYSIEDLLKKAS